MDVGMVEKTATVKDTLICADCGETRRATALGLAETRQIALFDHVVDPVIAS